jgi:DNA gyrase/topoisomerase IV subunit B
VNAEAVGFRGEPDRCAQIVNKASLPHVPAWLPARRELTRRKSALDGMSLPGKLADCSINDPGGGALHRRGRLGRSGSTKRGRDRGFRRSFRSRKIINAKEPHQQGALEHQIRR